MKYLKLFKTHTKYETHSSEEMILPNVSKCILEDEVHYNPWTWADEYLTFVAKESGTFTFTPQNSNVISYSIDDGITWTQGNSINVGNGNKVMWKGTMTPISGDGIGTFSSTAEFDVQGNVMSLLYGDNYKWQINLTGKNYAFYSLFSTNTKLVNAENLSLPATTLSNYCYRFMFYGCTSLVTIPELPATILADHCYNEMFYGCTSLITAPELLATTLADSCYAGMFCDCTSLTTAPKLPATTLSDHCYYYMFQDCTSLINAPKLPAMTLAIYCYSNMFEGCTSLTTAPALLSTTLEIGCYNSMFQGCTSLINASELPATTLEEDCYNAMFQGCTNLNYIKAMFTTTPSGSSPNYYTQNWVSGVSATGTFVKNSAATWNVSGIHGIPSGWAVQTASA